MNAARALAFFAGLYAWTALVGICGLPTLALPRPVPLFVTRLWAEGVVALLAATVGLRHRAAGRENLPRGPVIVAAKHQSAWETLAFPMLIEDPAIVYKRSLLWVPVLGWYLWRLRMIPVDRAGRARALKRMLRAARRASEAGRPILVFPEGTRTAPGTRRAYRPGVYALYRELGLLVVPVALNSGVFWPRRRFAKRPGTIAVRFLPPIPPGLKRAEFMRELAERIETATYALTTEARRHGGD